MSGNSYLIVLWRFDFVFLWFIICVISKIVIYIYLFTKIIDNVFAL